MDSDKEATRRDYSQMKRPKFFEDLDRSLSGEPEPEPEPEITPREDAKIRAQALQNLHQGNAALMAMHAQCAQMEADAMRMHEAQMQAIRNTTATGAMIAARQQNLMLYSTIASSSVWFPTIPEE